MKKVNQDLKKFAEAKLEWVNTPNKSNLSPAQMFFGRKQRTKLPHLQEATKLDPSNAMEGAQKRKADMKRWALKKKPHLNEFKPGQRCIVQDPDTKKWDKQGRIVSSRNSRSYTVLLNNRKLYIRNRHFIRPDNARQQKETEEGEVQERNTENEERNMEDQQRKPLRRSKRIAESNEQPSNRGSAVRECTLLKKRRYN